MPEGFILEVFVVQVIMIITLLIVILWLLRASKSIKKEKRIGEFALYSLKDGEKSFFEHIELFLLKIVSLFSKLLSKSVVLRKYAMRYDKHISYEERNKKNSMDYVAIKFMLGLLLVILHILTITFQYVAFNPMGFLISFLIGFFIPDIILAVSFAKKRQRVADDLLKAIIIMNNAFKSGRNIMQAIEIVKTELDGPISDEFSKIYMDITYGLSLEVVFGRFYDRVQLEDAKYITSSLALLNRTGGNIVKVFASIEKSFYNKKKLRNELNSMTASSLFVFRVLIFLPFVFALVIYLLNPSYFVPLFTTSLGMAILCLIIIIFALYILIIKKVLRIDI